MAGRAIRFTLELDADAIGLFDHMPISDDIALRIDNYAGAQRTLANVAGVRSALAAEKLVEEILKLIVVAALLVGSLAWLSAAGSARADSTICRDGILAVTGDRMYEVYANRGAPSWSRRPKAT